MNLSPIQRKLLMPLKNGARLTLTGQLIDIIEILNKSDRFVQDHKHTTCVMAFEEVERSSAKLHFDDVTD